jgi:phosphoribosyl-ATP pyrophosphohydrolase
MLSGMSDSIARLYAATLAARTADPAASRTARLLRSGRAKMAKKLAEEAVEVVIDAIDGEHDAVVRESADLIYNLVVLWTASGIKPAEVWKEMDRRERLFGIAEKLPKQVAAAEPRRRAAAVEQRRIRKRH